MQIVMGVDIGQRVDPTAIAVTEAQWRKRRVADGTYELEDHYVVRHLERLKLGTPYPKVVERITRLREQVEERVQLASLENRAGDLSPTDLASITVYMDATGVGQPVVDMVKKALVKVIGVYFNHGDRRREDLDKHNHDRIVSLGKAYMVSTLQALLQTGRLHLPRTEEALALGQELLDYEIKVNEKANDTYGAFKVGAHDDLVTALGLTVQTPPSMLAATASSAPVFQPHLDAYGADSWGKKAHASSLSDIVRVTHAARQYGKRFGAADHDLTYYDELGRPHKDH